MKRLATAPALLLCLGTSSEVATQSVIFPEQQQPGVASLAVSNGTYTLSNDLLSATFTVADGKLTFGGCEAMSLQAAENLFVITKQDGTEIASSQMTLGEVKQESLTGDANAAKGSHKFNGVQLCATFTLTKAFTDQTGLTGLTEGQAINIDDKITVTLPGSSVYVFDGVDGLAETEAITLPVSKYGIATFCADHETIIPAGAKAYVALNDPELPADESEMGVIVMTEITNVVPANTGVVILAEEGDYDFVASNGSTAAVDGNLLQGYGGRAEYDVVVKPTDATNYVLTVKNDIAAFYRKANHFKVYRNRAYLNVPAEMQTKGIRMKFENEDGTTEIVDVLMGNDNAAPIFDLSGRRVQTPQKGVYIINGKKVIF